MREYIVYILIGAGAVVFIAAAVILLRVYLIVLVDRRIAAYQNDLVVRHYTEVQNIYSQMRGWRHDYHSHIQTMKALLEMDRKAEHSAYLSKLDADLTSVDTVLKTGNVMVDAILNSKISLAKSKDIQINAKAAVPAELSVSEVDLCVMIGNLLDNAMEACLKIESAPSRFIRIYIGRNREMLYISVSNSSGGEVRKSGKTYFSTKDSPSHGFGLARIDRIAAKYDGFVNRQSEEGVFATEITLPM